jgi:drug/metabolite transporter (DMT)-like permease
VNIVQFWFVFALIAVFCKTWFYVLQKKYLDDDVSPYTTAYIASLYGAIIVTPLATIEIALGYVSLDLYLIPLLILFGILESIYFLVYLFALQNLNLSIASPVKKSKPVFVGITEPIILGAYIPLVLIGASILATIGGVMSVFGTDDSIDSYKNDITKIGLFFAFITLVFSVTMSLVSRYGTSEISPFVFGAGVMITMTVITRILLYDSDVENMKINLTSKKGFTLGIVGAFRSIFVWIAYSLIIATAVSIVTQTTLILDVLLAKYYLDEDVTRVQMFGIVLIFIGSIIAITIV